MIHDHLVRWFGARAGGLLCGLVYAAMLLAVIHLWGRPAAGLAYLH